MKPRQYKEEIDRQTMPLPPTIDECIDEDNIVRAIDAYVDTLNLEEMGFEYAGGTLTTKGQPAYPPSALLKLYIWGYLNRTNSSRRLELETYRNLEVIWLLRGLNPCYRTICNFRSHNKKAMKEVAKDFMLLCKDLGLFGGRTVAIDGAFFEGDASKASIKTKKQLIAATKRLKNKINKYLAEKEEKAQSDPILQEMEKQLQSYQEKLDILEENGETQYSTTDKDARLLTKASGKNPTAGYNVQIVVDDEHKLIVAHDVVNDGNDSQQLARMAKKAKEVMEVDSLDALADGAYYNQQKIKECIDADIIPYVPVPKRKRPTNEEARFKRKDFQYDSETDSYICPMGESLKPKGVQNKKLKGGKKKMVKYTSNEKNCATCTKQKECLPLKAPYRQIYRWEYEEVAEDHEERMAENGAEKMQERGALAEHPFGTLKLWLGWTHFLLRGLEKVVAELDLLITCYNFKRVLNIVGIDVFRAYCEQRNKTAQMNKKEVILFYFYTEMSILSTIFTIFLRLKALLMNFVYSRRKIQIF
jgi:transposase